MLLTSVAFFMVALDALVVVTALPAIHRSVGGSLATLPAAGESFRTVRTARFAEVLRGVAFTPER